MEEINVVENLKWLNNVCNFYARGKEIYEACLNVLNEAAGTELIVSPANLGDTVFIATLAKAYKKAHGIQNLLIAAKQRQADIAQWFEGVDGTVGLEDDEMMFLRYYLIISRLYYNNGIRYGHVPCYVDALCPGTFLHIQPGFTGIPLMEVWKKRILDLPDDVELGKLIVPEEFHSDNSDRFDNAVLIAPAAFTNKGIPDTFWEKLVQGIRDKGLEVYCNSGGLYYDKIIAGSTEYVSTTRELILNAPLFRHIVAVRSGFTDLVTKTEAKMTVLHLGESGDAPIRIEYGTRLDDVRDLGRMDGIYPVLYDPNREDEVIRTILEDI